MASELCAACRRWLKVRAAMSAASAVLTWSASAGAPAAELPVPCVAGACGVQVPGFISSGQGGLSQVGNTLNVDQFTERATFNWKSFSISADGTVNFNQPSSNSVALNRIHGADPSRIFGALKANGRIY